MSNHRGPVIIYCIQLAISAILGALIIRPQQSMTVSEYQSVRLRCSTNHSYPVSWKAIFANTSHSQVIYSGGQVATPFTEKYSVDTSSEGQYDLIISRVTKSEEAVFICSDKSGIGESARSALTVEEVKMDKINIPKTNLQVAVTGHVFEMQCNTTSSSHPAFFNFHRNGSNQRKFWHCSDDAKEGRVTINATSVPGLCSLVIYPVKPSDAGYYQCGTQELDVIVLDSEIFYSTNHLTVSASEMNTLNISCHLRYSGNWSPVLIWEINEVEIPPDDVGYEINDESIPGEEVSSRLLGKNSLPRPDDSKHTYKCSVEFPNDKPHESQPLVTISSDTSSSAAAVCVLGSLVIFFAIPCLILGFIAIKRKYHGYQQPGQN